MRIGKRPLSDCCVSACKIKSGIPSASLHSSDAIYTKKVQKKNLKHLGHYILPHGTLVEGLGLKCSGFLFPGFRFDGLSGSVDEGLGIGSQNCSPLWLRITESVRQACSQCSADSATQSQPLIN